MLPTSAAPISDHQPGELLKELEQRQDDVLEQLDALDAQLREVLQGLGVSAESEAEEVAPAFVGDQD